MHESDMLVYLVMSLRSADLGCNRVLFRTDDYVPGLLVDWLREISDRFEQQSVSFPRQAPSETE